MRRSMRMAIMRRSRSRCSTRSCSRAWASPWLACSRRSSGFGVTASIVACPSASLFASRAERVHKKSQIPSPKPESLSAALFGFRGWDLGFLLHGSGFLELFEQLRRRLARALALGILRTAEEVAAATEATLAELHRT